MKDKTKEFTARLRRLAGQAAALERIYAERDKARFVVQLQAVIAAGQATLAAFAAEELIGSSSEEDAKLLARLIKRG